jgi:hypothetical protein
MKITQKTKRACLSPTNVLLVEIYKYTSKNVVSFIQCKKNLRIAVPQNTIRSIANSGMV